MVSILMKKRKEKNCFPFKTAYMLATSADLKFKSV